MIEITDAALRKAAGEGMDTFIQVFTDRYKEVIWWLLSVDTEWVWWLYFCQSIC